MTEARRALERFGKLLADKAWNQLPLERVEHILSGEGSEGRYLFEWNDEGTEITFYLDGQRICTIPGDEARAILEDD